MSNGFIYVVDAHFIDKIEENKYVKIKHIPGDVKIKHIPGDVKIKHIPGDVKIKHIPGDVKI
jgi:DUF4097 and DUF4098 domain-containing protein YvlB